MSDQIHTPSVCRMVVVKRTDGEPVSNGQLSAPAVVQTAHGQGACLINCMMFPDCAPAEQLTSIPHESKPAGRYVWAYPPRVG